MPHFDIEHIDHVAIYVKNPTESIDWYSKVLGLKEHRAKAWDPYPVFMLSGEIGVAIFKADENSVKPEPSSLRIDHFAFRLTNRNFDLARKFFNSSNISYEFKDHTYFHSIYLKDPDNHTVELTTLTVSKKEFY